MTTIEASGRITDESEVGPPLARRSGRATRSTRYQWEARYVWILLAVDVIVSLAAAGLAYETRYLFVGTDEYQRVIRAGLAATAAVAIASYAAGKEIARGYVLVALP